MVMFSPAVMDWASTMRCLLPLLPARSGKRQRGLLYSVLPYCERLRCVWLACCAADEELAQSQAWAGQTFCWW